MSTIQSSITFATPIDAPLEQVRDAITDPAWHKWLPFLSATEYEGTAAGSRRVCTMASPDPQMNGYVLQETIEGVDEGAGRLSYAIQNPPMLVENLRGSVEASQNEAGQVIATWTATFSSSAEALEQSRPLMLHMYQLGLQGLEAYAQEQAKVA